MAKKKKTKPVVAADDDFVKPVKGKKGQAVLDDEDDADDESDSGKPRAKADVYFGLTLLTTLILIGAAALLYYDQEDLKKPDNTGFNPPMVSAGPLGLRAAAPK